MQERDSAVARLSQLHRENEELRERLDSTQRAWSTMCRDQDERRTSFHDTNRFTHSHESHGRPFKDPMQTIHGTQMQDRAFKDALATMLSDGYCTVEPFEEMIKERVHNLVIAVRDKNAVSF